MVAGLVSGGVMGCSLIWCVMGCSGIWCGVVGCSVFMEVHQVRDTTRRLGKGGMRQRGKKLHSPLKQMKAIRNTCLKRGMNSTRI